MTKQWCKLSMTSRRESLSTCDARRPALGLALTVLVSFSVACEMGQGSAAPEPEVIPDFFDAVVLSDPPVVDVPPAITPPQEVGSEQEWLEIGPVQVQGGRSAAIHVVVPNGMQALTMHMRGHEGVLLLLDEAVDPNGVALVSPTTQLSDAQRLFSGARGFPSQFFSTTRQVARVSDATARLPLVDTERLTPGVWTLRVRSASSQTAEPIAVDRPIQVALLGDREVGVDDNAGVVGERLRLAVHFVGQRLTAERAEDDATFTTMMDEVRAIFDAANIEIVVESFHDVGGEASVVELEAARGCSGGDLDSLLQQAQAAPGARSLFFVDRFRCVNAAGIDVGAFIGGLSGGIPAPVFVSGSARGGVVVSTASEGVSDGFTSPVMPELIAHELGHALGLFHVLETTTPPDPEVFDIVSDTVNDEAASQSNLMFPRLNGRTRLTDGQSEVLRRHPGVRQ